MISKCMSLALTSCQSPRLMCSSCMLSVGISNLGRQRPHWVSPPPKPGAAPPTWCCSEWRHHSPTGRGPGLLRLRTSALSFTVTHSHSSALSANHVPRSPASHLLCLNSSRLRHLSWIDSCQNFLTHLLPLLVPFYSPPSTQGDLLKPCWRACRSLA